MTTLGYAGRVGLVFLVAAALFTGGWIYLSGGIATNTYAFDVLFDDAKGVTPDTPVQLAGVQIGKVESVTLTQSQKADLRLKIQKKLNGRDVLIPHGSQFLIVTPILGTSGIVTVVPPPAEAQRPGDVIHDGEVGLQGEQSGDLTTSFNKANILLSQVTETTKKVDVLLDQATRFVGDQRLQHGLEQTVSNVDAASANGLLLTRRLNGLLLEDNAQVQALLHQTQAGAQSAFGNISQTTAQVRDITRENHAQINEIIGNLRDTTAATAGLTQQASDLLSKGGVTQNLSATVANLKTTTDKLNAIVGNFQSLTGDPKVQGNLRDTVQNIRDSSDEARLLLERLNTLAGTKRKTAAAVVVVPGGPTVIVPNAPHLPSPAPASVSAPYFLPRVDLIQNTRASHFRMDLDAIVPLSGSGINFGRAGVYGLGDTNKLILQGGKTVDDGGLADLRAGIYASKLSVGGDIGLGQRATLSFDAYDPNLLHLDARGVLMLAPELGLTAGAEDITRHSGAIVGVEYRRTH